MKAKDVFEHYQDEAAFEKVPWKNFSDRLKRLRNKVVDKNNRSKRDADALVHDRKIYPTQTHNEQGQLRWHGSEAEKLLEKDVDEEKHISMTKIELYNSRLEYQHFNLRVFRGHVYQELKKRKFLAYCKTTKRGKEYGAQQLIINKRRAEAEGSEQS
ncbi:hypothetical protein SEMRO_295_G110320.1 [Seminavis robusta]|uniref:Uncharacterized protein n=1 Tax=Seminavis robusta TaxID=568900 RepID=A0A9N8DQ97_9STRA|nr:hypothetical protein SEMRO_295_G110320.1 [Seminavis robusta]|eukprot:Sro295_g110320.1 n/a (157) ;mRNA; r:3057-3527